MTPDMWTRTYEEYTAVPGVTRRIYRWLAAAGPYLEQGPRANMHPPYPYRPPSARQPVANYAIGNTEADDRGIVYRRLTAPPTLVADSFAPYWDMSAWAVEEVILCTNADANKGVGHDSHGNTLAWELGGADFSTPFPTWMFTEPPTHLRILSAGYMGQIIVPLLASASGGLSAASVEVPEFNHIFSVPTGSDADPMGDHSFGRIEGNGGPIESRFTAFDPWAAQFGYNYPTITRSTATGDLLGGMSRSHRGRAIHSAYEDVPAYWNDVRIIHRHRTSLPTLRYRSWGTTGYAGEFAYGTWTIVHHGLRGNLDTQTINFYPTRTSGLFADALAYDASLDMNGITAPAGTLYSTVRAESYGDGTTTSEVLEGPESVCFADHGTRSDVGGSVYIPGRVLKLGNLSDAGVAT